MKATDNLVEVLQQLATERPDALAFQFLLEGEREGPRLSYAGVPSPSGIPNTSPS